MHILVIGANSQLGKSLKSITDKKNVKHSFVFASREQLDLSSIFDIEIFIKTGNFDLIINCAAYTNVDKAETNEIQANLINHLAVKKIAEVSQNNKVKLIHISTDFVFDGEKNEPYIEIDNAAPINIYGKSKYAGEQSIQSVMKKNAIIIRTSWLYSEYGNNFVNTILRLSKTNKTLNVVIDQIGSPTYAKDLGKVILSIINSKNYGSIDQPTRIYHFSNEGTCSWFDFATEIVKISGGKCLIIPILSKDYHSKANRPKYASLSSRKLIQTFGIDAISWKDSLIKCISNIEN